MNTELSMCRGHQRCQGSLIDSRYNRLKSLLRVTRAPLFMILSQHFFKGPWFCEGDIENLVGQNKDDPSANVNDYREDEEIAENGIANHKVDYVRFWKEVDLKACDKVSYGP